MQLGKRPSAGPAYDLQLFIMRVIMRAALCCAVSRVIAAMLARQLLAVKRLVREGQAKMLGRGKFGFESAR